MPNKVKHKEQISSNERFFKHINKDEDKFYDWNITVLFYTILHYADAYCAEKGHTEFNGHREREEFLKTDLDYDIFTNYMHLKSASVNSRYKVMCLGAQAKNYCIKIHQGLYIPLKNYFEKMPQ